MPSRSPSRSLPLVAPLAVSSLGAFIARAPGAFFPNVVAALLGIVGCLVWQRTPAPARAFLLARAPWVALGLLALTLLAPGVDGVHRWLAHLNVSTATAPLLLAGCAAPSASSVGLVFAALLVHLAQPDAAQSTALGAAFAVGLLSQSSRAALAIPALILALSCWLRPDPLLPVNAVERVVLLAAQRGPLVFLVTVLAVVALFVPLARSTHRLAPVLLTYALFAFWAPFAGNFPVPVLGAGAGPVLGYYVMLALLDDRAPRE